MRAAHLFATTIAATLAATTVHGHAEEWQAAYTARVYGDLASEICPRYGFKVNPAAWRALSVGIDPAMAQPDVRPGGLYEKAGANVRKRVHDDMEHFGPAGWCESLRQWAYNKYPAIETDLISPPPGPPPAASAMPEDDR